MLPYTTDSRLLKPTNQLHAGKEEALAQPADTDDGPTRRCMLPGRPGVVAPGLEGEAAEVADQQYDMGAAERDQEAAEALVRDAKTFHFW
jgi:hypothetical protein